MKMFSYKRKQHFHCRKIKLNQKNDLLLIGLMNTFQGATTEKIWWEQEGNSIFIF